MIPERPPDAADASEFVRQTIGLSASAREATLAEGLIVGESAGVPASPAAGDNV